MSTPRRISAALAATTLLIIGSGAGACEEVPRTFSSAGAESEALFIERFDDAELGPDWAPTGEGARVEDGALVVEGLRNHPLWLTRPLPDDFRVDFDTWTEGDEGDIKVEFAGDGESAATRMNYIASGYVLIFGGWNNSVSGIFRQSEHGRAKQVTDAFTVEAGRRYHVTITRVGGSIRWELNGREVVSYEDARPLVGPGYQHFAFSGWESRVHFDNLVIRAL